MTKTLAGTLILIAFLPVLLLAQAESLVTKDISCKSAHLYISTDSISYSDTSNIAQTTGHAGLSIDQFVQFSQVQHLNQWCWAACISMLFSYYGHPVSQNRIVSEVYGMPINMPAGAGIVLASQLNRSWQDDSQNQFQSILTAAYDLQWGVATLNNQVLVNELNSSHPIIIGVGTHAVVLVEVDYIQYPNGFINVTSAKVFDPWPGVGFRFLSPQEMIPAWGGYIFAATVRLQ